jgi:hypothetical protein
MLYFHNAHFTINTTNIAIPPHDEAGILDQPHMELP